MTTPPTALTSPNPEHLLATALRLARLGYPVFPCRPDEKRPLTRHGLLDATTDPAQIRTWWQRTPTANLAITTGAGSVDVLDVDIRPHASGYAAFNRLTRAGLLHGKIHTIVTPSGGLHAYFTGTDQPCGRLPDHLLDFKATGGYVVAPPSVVAGRPYELLRRYPTPHTSLDWSTVRTALEPDTTPPRSPSQTPQPASTQSIEHLARWVAALPEGRRNDGTFWAACRAVEHGFTDLTPLIDAATTAGLPRREASRTIASALRIAHATSRAHPAAASTATPASGRRPGPGR